MKILDWEFWNSNPLKVLLMIWRFQFLLALAMVKIISHHFLKNFKDKTISTRILNMPTYRIITRWLHLLYGSMASLRISSRGVKLLVNQNSRGVKQLKFGYRYACVQNSRVVNWPPWPPSNEAPAYYGWQVKTSQKFSSLHPYFLILPTCFFNWKLYNC